MTLRRSLPLAAALATLALSQASSTAVAQSAPKAPAAPTRQQRRADQRALNKAQAQRAKRQQQISKGAR